MEGNDMSGGSQIETSVQPKPSASTRKSHTRKRQVNKEEKASIRQFHRENPFVTHSNIANIFGLERSTISKILGQAITESSPTPISVPLSLESQANQLHTPDRNSFIPQSHTTPSSIQRALYNWAQQTQRSGVRVTQPMLRQQAANLAAMAWTDQYKTNVSGSKAPEVWNTIDTSMHDFRPSSMAFSPLHAAPQTPPPSGCLTPSFPCFGHTSMSSSPDAFNTTNTTSGMTNDSNLLPVSMDDVLLAMNSPEICATLSSPNAGEVALNTLQECLQKSAPLTPFDYLCLEHLREKLARYETQNEAL